MPRVRVAEQALRLYAHSPRQPYICKTCRAHAVRQFHSSHVAAAEVPFLKRIQQTLFGSKEAKEAEQKREDEAEKRTMELAKRDAGARRTKKIGVMTYEVAAVVNPEVNKDYVPSTTWDGLEKIGSRQFAKAKADKGEKYIGFIPEKRIQLTDEQWAKLLHHITVEVLTLQRAGRDLNQVCSPRRNRASDWQRTKYATITSENANGNASLHYTSPQYGERVLEAIIRTESIMQNAEVENVPEQLQHEGQSHDVESKSSLVPRTEQAVSLNQLVAYLDGELTQYSNGTMSWMNMQLRDPQVKLAIIKRTMQLTGHRLPDPVISNANTLADLHDAFKVKEKPKKLAQTEQMQRLKVEVPNVAVHARRRTPIDKEKEVGRWKVIEEELIARDLPVYKSRWQEAKPSVGL